MSDETGARRAINSMVKSELILGNEVAPLISAIDAAVQSHAQFIDDSGDTPVPVEHLQRAIHATAALGITLETLL